MTQKQLPANTKSFTQALEGFEDSKNGEQLVTAVELLVSGMSLGQVAKRLDVTKKEVISWLQDNPEAVEAIKIGKGALDDWRLHLIQRQYALAASISEKLLTLDEELLSIPPKLLTIIQKQANTVLQMGTSKNIEVQDGSVEASFLATSTALDYIASRLAAQPPGPQEVRVVIPGGFSEKDTKVIDAPPFGVYGSVDKSDAGFLCHICGSAFDDLYTHVTRGHKMKATNYEAAYMLDTGVLKSCR